MNISTSKVSFTLKYSIATFLLCTSSFATGVSIYPVSLAIFNATGMPMLFVAIASISAIVALSSAIYLVKSAISAINNKNTCNILEEKQNGNGISVNTPVAITIQPSLSTSNSNEPVTNSDTSTKIPEKIPVTLPVPPPPPPPLPNQGVSTPFTPPPPPPLPLPNQNASIAFLPEKTLREIFTQIRGNVNLKKVESQSESNIGNNDPRANLLKEIREGIKLKKAESQKGNKISTIGQGDIAKILARRVPIESSSSESEHSENEFSWNDDDQDAQSSNKKEAKKFMNGIETKKSMPSQNSNIISSEAKSNNVPFISPSPSLLAPLPTEDLKNWKTLKNSDTSKKSPGSTISKNSSYNKQKSIDRITPELLQEHLKKMREKSKHLEDLSNVKTKDNKDNTKHRTQQKYAEKTEEQQEEKNEVEGKNDNDWIRTIISESVPPSVKLIDVKKIVNSGHSSGYSSDLEDYPMC